MLVLILPLIFGHITPYTGVHGMSCVQSKEQKEKLSTTKRIKDIVNQVCLICPRLVSLTLRLLPKKISRGYCVPSIVIVGFLIRALRLLVTSSMHVLTVSYDSLARITAKVWFPVCGIYAYAWVYVVIKKTVFLPEAASILVWRPGSEKDSSRRFEVLERRAPSPLSFTLIGKAAFVSRICNRKLTVVVWWIWWIHRGH